MARKYLKYRPYSPKSVNNPPKKPPSKLTFPRRIAFWWGWDREMPNHCMVSHFWYYEETPKVDLLNSAPFMNVSLRDALQECINAALIKDEIEFQAPGFYRNEFKDEIKKHSKRWEFQKLWLDGFAFHWYFSAVECVIYEASIYPLFYRSENKDEHSERIWLWIPIVQNSKLLFKLLTPQ